MPTTYTKPDQNLSFAIPDEGEVFGVAGNDQNFYRRRGNTIETVNYVNALLGNEAGQFGNAGEQRQEALRRAQAQGLNLDAQTYNWGDITSTGLFQLGGNSGPTSTYSGDLASFFNTRAQLPTSQQTLTRGTPTINPYGMGALTDQFGNVVQQQTQNTVAQAQANALAENAGLLAPTPEMTRIAEANAQLMGPTGQVPQGYGANVQGQLIPSVATLPRQALIQGQLPQAARDATNLDEFYRASGMSLPSVSERGGLFERAGLGSAGEYRGTASQNAALLKTLQSQAGMGGTAGLDIAKEITTDIFKGVQGLQMPPPPIPNTGAGLMAGYEELLKELSKPTQAEKDADATGQKILSEIEKLGGEQQDLINQRNAELQRMGFANEADYDKQVNDLMSSMRTDITNYKVQSEQIRNQAIPMSFVIGQQNELDRSYALKSGEKALMLDTLKGYGDSANERAKELVDAKYSQIENEIKYLSAVYDMNKDKISREDQKQAQALELWLGMRQEALDAQKEEDMKVYEMGMEVLRNGGGTALANKVFQSGSFAEAAKLGGSFVGLLDRQTTQSLNNQRNNPIVSGTTDISGNISSVTGKPLTEGERVAQGYAQRAQEAHNILDSLESQFTGLGSYIGQIAPNFLKSADRQKFEQAQRNFVNSVLRKESGAVISDAEFNNARKQYFAQPGDSSEVVAQKRQNRQTKIQSLYREGGASQPTTTNTTTQTDEDPLGIFQ